jgi:copper ion binding protein
MKITLKINGMTCEHCKMHVEKALSGLAGVSRADVSLFWKKATVETDEDISDQLLRDTIADIGYEVIAIKR